MREAALNSSSFPTARCRVCGKIVLTCVGRADDGGERRLCVHCDSLIESELVWVSAAELEAEGYFIGDPPARRGGGGCGASCGGCATRGN
jgi:hypothetical protein